MFVSGYAQRKGQKINQNPSGLVFYTYPIQCLQNAWKMGVDFNISDRYVLHGFTRMSFGTKLTTTELEDGGGGPIGNRLQGRYANEASMGFMVRHRVGEYSRHNNNYYFLTFFEAGVITEAYSSQFAPTLQPDYIYQQAGFRRLGVGFGRQYSLFGNMILDANFSLGFYDVDGTFIHAYRKAAIFRQGEDEVIATGNLGLGIGNKRIGPPRHTSKFLYALAIDVGSMLRNGIEVNGIGNMGKRGTWVLGVGYGNNINQNINVTAASSFSWYNSSFEYRLYAANNPHREGAYLGIGASVGHMTATIRDQDRYWNWKMYTRYFDVGRFEWSVGFTDYLNDQFLLNMFVRHKMIYSVGDNERRHAHSDFATGIRTEIGLKLGIANFTADGNSK
ncbi:MAG: hypothetical protein H6608_12825 [Flavobacteriales bacterium]|nr:hypothetical protein [Bacteroidota bacterium]MCB9242016.1 hypothetical protein [Flavobacteriales bacterium]